MGVASETERGTNRPKKGERSGQNKLRKMGMMGGWMEAKAHMSIKVKLTAGTRYWDNWDAQQRFEDR